MTEKKRVTIYINDENEKILNTIKINDNISKSEIINLAITDYLIQYIEKKEKIKKYSKTL